MKIVTVELESEDLGYVMDKLQETADYLQGELNSYHGSDIYRQLLGDEMVALERILGKIKGKLDEAG